MEEQLFRLVDSFGEGIFNKIHIIDNSMLPDEIKEYRVYHADGYCWDISMMLYNYNEFDDRIEPLFIFSENWDGFKQSGIDFAISEVSKTCLLVQR